MVDADASTNGLTLFCLPQVLEKKKGFESARGMFDPDTLGALTRCEVESNLELIPATYKMRNTEDVGLSHFRNALQQVRQKSDCDFILLDAQAGIDPFAKAAAEIADQIIIVSEYDPISVQGIERLKVIFADVMRPDNVWILFNKILPEFAKAIGDGLLIARYLPPISWDADVVRAFALRQPILNLARPNAYCITIINILKVLFPGEVSSLLDLWISEHQQAIQEPLVSRLEEIDKTIKELEARRISIDLSLRNQDSITTFLMFLALLVIGVAGVGGWYFFNRWGAYLGTVAVVFVATLGAIGFFVESFQSMEKRERGERSEIERKLDEAREDRKKYKAILDAAGSLSVQAGKLLS